MDMIDIEKFSTNELHIMRLILSSIKSNSIEQVLSDVESAIESRRRKETTFTDDERRERFKDEICGFLNNTRSDNRDIRELSVELLSTEIARYYRMERDEILRCLREIHNDGLIRFSGV